MYGNAESEYFGSARFGGGSGPIWMSDLTCAGTEASLFTCTSNTPLGSVQNTTTCTHLNDVSIRCSGYSPGNLTLFLLLLDYLTSDIIHISLHGRGARKHSSC